MRRRARRARAARRRAGLAIAALQKAHAQCDPQLPNARCAPTRWCAPIRVLTLLPSPRGRAEGFKAEEEFAKSGKVPDPASTDNAEFKIVLRIIADGLKKNPKL